MKPRWVHREPPAPGGNRSPSTTTARSTGPRLSAFRSMPHRENMRRSRGRLDAAAGRCRHCRRPWPFARGRRAGTRAPRVPHRPPPRGSAAPGMGGSGQPKAFEGWLVGAETQSPLLCPPGHSLSRERQTQRTPGVCPARGRRREPVELVRKIVLTRSHRRDVTKGFRGQSPSIPAQPSCRWELPLNARSEQLPRRGNPAAPPLELGLRSDTRGEGGTSAFS